MLGFGARPRFGLMLLGRVALAAYCTAPGHRFGRDQYLILSAAPAVLISAAGLIACWATPWAGVLVFPLAAHLGGCVGDGAAIAKLLREPADVLVEDLRDGLRIFRPAA